ncbi:redox-sensing transcriptional repressor Rex, partial [Chloroflexota bacterium]
YKGFINRGFRVTLIFDGDPDKIGTQISEFTVLDSTHMVDIIIKTGIRIAMIAVPAAKAQQVADQLVEAGIQAILNYAPINLNVPSNVRVQYIDPSIHLQRMTYYLE